MDTLTPRQVFDKVKAHLLKQNEKATSSREDYAGCAYRSADGLSCAVGCLIPDSLYDPVIEGQSVESASEAADTVNEEGLAFAQIDGSAVLWMILQELGITSAGHIKLLDALQDLHDSYLPQQWPEKFDEVERKFFGGAA